MYCRTRGQAQALLFPVVNQWVMPRWNTHSPEVVAHTTTD